MRVIYSIFLLNFKTTFRNLKSSGIMFILPIVFMAIFGLAFGGQSSIDFKLGINDDFDSGLVDTFSNISDESDNLSIEVDNYQDTQDLKTDVDKENIDIGIIVSQNNENQRYEYEIIIPGQSIGASVNRSVVIDVLNQIMFKGNNPITVNISNPDKDSLTGFDFLAPGLIIYGLIILIPGIAESLTEIKQKKYILRYAVSKVKAYEIILGSLSFYFLIGLIQIFILYLTALAFGYQSSGNIFLAAIPAISTFLFISAVGLLLGAMFDKTDGATNAGSIVSIILGFFSGSFIAGIGSILEFKVFGNIIQFNDLFPTKWGSLAVSKILTRDLGLADIKTEMVILLASGIITLVLASLIYSKKQLQSNLDSN